MLFLLLQKTILKASRSAPAAERTTAAGRAAERTAAAETSSERVTKEAAAVYASAEA